MGKSDDKGEPVKTVTIGGKKVEVPIIFVLPEESGEKEIERYERPKVHIKKDDKAAESKEEPLEELTDGKLEEIEKPKFVAPKIAGGYGKAQALKRTKELQDKRRADEEKALYIAGGAREKDIENQSKKSWKSWLQKKEEWDKEESEWEQIGDTNRFRKRRKKKLQDAEEDLDINFDDSDAFGIDKLKALQLEIKDALKPEKNQGKMSTEEFGGRSGRNPKTGRELNDYLESQQPYGFGKLGKKEPQTSRGQADDATQERAMNYYSAKDPRSGRDSALKKPAREAGENTVRGDARIDQHEPKSHETASSGNDWKSSNRVGRDMYDQEPLSEIKDEDYDKDGKLTHHKIREVPRGGKAPRDSPEPLGRKAQFTGNEKLMRQMAGYPPSYFEDTYDKEEERRRDTKLPKTGKSPKGTKVRKKAWEKWMVRL